MKNKSGNYFNLFFWRGGIFCGLAIINTSANRRFKLMCTALNNKHNHPPNTPEDIIANARFELKTYFFAQKGPVNPRKIYESFCTAYQHMLSEQEIKMLPFCTVPLLYSDLDPFHFGQPDRGSKKSAKIMENFHQNH